MSETLPRAASYKINVETPTTEALHILVNGEVPTQHNTLDDSYTTEQPPEPAETVENSLESRETSRSAGLLRRVASLLERRAVNKAHTAALKEYRKTNVSDYVDHAFTLANSDNEAYREVGQRLLGREDRREDMRDLAESAHTFAKNTGEAALGAALATGEVAVGLGVIAGKKVAAKAGEVTDTVKNAVDMGIQGAYDYTEAAKATYRNAKDTLQDQYTSTKDSVKNTVDFGLQSAYDYTEAAKDAYRDAKGELQDRYIDTKDTVKNKLTELADWARDRRTKRRAKWAARKQAALDLVTTVKNTTIDIATSAIDAGHELVTTARQEGQRVIGETSGRINTARAAGSAALEAYAATTRAHTEQNKL